MADDPVSDDASGDPGSLEEWLEHVAESEGIPEQEVRDRMMSSYWILHELTGLMEDSADRGGASGDASPAESPPAGGGDGGDGLDDEELERLVEAANALGLDSPTTGGGDSRRLEESVERLDTEIERLHDDIDRLTTRIDNAVDGGAMGRGPQGYAEAGASREDLAELSSQIEALGDQLSELESRHRSERQRVNDNFGHVEDILQYLVERMETLDGKVETATERIGEGESGDPDRERLVEIKRAANEHGVGKAACEGCDHTVDISLLERPECPSCGRPFDGLSPKSGWFGSNTLTTAPPGYGSPTREPPTDDEGDDRPAPDADVSEEIEGLSLDTDSTEEADAPVEDIEEGFDFGPN